jgi:hypothetical protein
MRIPRCDRTTLMFCFYQQSIMIVRTAASEPSAWLAHVVAPIGDTPAHICFATV